MEPKTLVKVEDVRKSFRIGAGDVEVLKGISFEIKKGDFLIIFGPSGCGKSTLVHTILGLEKPSSGKITFLDKDLYAWPTDDERAEFRKKNVGMVYQQANWIKSLTVLENVSFPLALLGMDKMLAEVVATQALESVGMADKAGFIPAELSGGQQQKVALARALVSNPEVIFCDEPTGNLDYESGQDIMKSLVSLNTQQGKTILMVTHDLEYLKYAKTVVRMFDGSVVGIYSGDKKSEIASTVKTKRGSNEIHLLESNKANSGINAEAAAHQPSPEAPQPETFSDKGATFSDSGSALATSAPAATFSDQGQVFSDQGSSGQVAPTIPTTFSDQGSSTSSQQFSDTPSTATEPVVVIEEKGLSGRVKRGFRAIWGVKDVCWQVLSFSILIILFLITTQIINRIVHLFRLNKLGSIKPISLIPHTYNKITKILDYRKQGHISRFDLIDLSLRHMKAKKARSAVTIGGMAIGIGSIVFMVSIGYGLESLVISRVARLEEMKQIDVVPQIGGKVKVNDKTIGDFKELSNVKMSLPLIAIVGKIDYNQSVSDVAVYGVTSEYLEQSAIKPVRGTIFNSNDLSFKVPHSYQEVAGVATVAKTAAVKGDKIQDISFSVEPGGWLKVRQKPDRTSKVLGYTKRIEGQQNGEEVLGGSYPDNAAGKVIQDAQGNWLGRWISSSWQLWKLESCQTENPDCIDGKYLAFRDEQGSQVQEKGYVAEVGVTVEGTLIDEKNVLGVNAVFPEVKAASVSADLNWIDIASESGIINQEEVKTVDLPPSASKQAVVNRGMLKILGISEEEAVGKPLSISFVVVGNLLEDSKSKIESASSDYQIVGVTPDDRIPLMYVPFMDLRALGVTSYSQAKVVVDDQQYLNQIRRQVEGMGYRTSSVVDTVAQINSLFNNIRTVMVVVGLIALFVAALGMFNTLTVSLLERTREVGLMKAMGMTSYEVQELFLTESMIMGILGGVAGLMMGFFAGKGVGLALSVFAVLKGVGMIDISYLPTIFIAIVLSVSLFVGLITGVFPAKRASRISALDELRYE